MLCHAPAPAVTCVRACSPCREARNEVRDGAWSRTEPGTFIALTALRPPSQAAQKLRDWSRQVGVLTDAAETQPSLPARPSQFLPAQLLRSRHLCREPSG